MLSLWLRHQPEAAGLTLDAQGWTDVDDVLAAMTRAGVACDWLTLLRIVEESDKQRFELSGDAARIRARQGHSVAVELGWPQAAPPPLLYHGTVERFLRAILSEGLRPMRRVEAVERNPCAVISSLLYPIRRNDELMVFSLIGRSRVWKAGKM